MANLVWNNYQGNQWVRKSTLWQPDNADLQIAIEEGSDTITFALVNCTDGNSHADPLFLDAGGTSTDDFALTPTNGGLFSIEISSSSTGPDPNPATSWAWDITGVSASAPTVEQGQQITVSWTLNVGALTPPAFSLFSVLNGAADNLNNFVSPVFGNGVPVTVAANAPVAAYNQAYEVNYTDFFLGGSGLSLTVLPARPSALAVSLSGNNAALTWVNNSGTAPNAVYQYSNDPVFTGAVDVQAGVPVSNQAFTATDTNFSTGAWYFRVKSRENSLDSGWSNTATLGAEITPLPPVVITGGTLNRLRRRRKRDGQEDEDEEVLCLILFTRP